MPNFENSRKRLNDLMSQRAQLLQAAETAQTGGDTAGFQAKMTEIRDLNARIDDVKAIVDEADRYAKANAPVAGRDVTDDAELGRELLAGSPVTFAPQDAARLLRRNAGTLLSSTTLTPAGGGSEIHSGFTAQTSSLMDLVYTQNLTGLGSYEESYVVSEMAAQGANATTAGGTARATSDPTFAKSKIAPYECTTTSAVDRRLSSLSPADYYAKVQTMAFTALRRKINALIVNGDGQATPDMYGILSAKNTAGSVIYNKLANITAIDENTLSALVFGYGGDEFVGGNARLLVDKATLKKIGDLRGTNEKQKVFEVVPDAGNANIGVIKDGGLIVPYIIVSAIGSATLAYGDPINYLMGLFGPITVRVDESVYADKRMNAVLGDALVGGNLIVDKGFVVQGIKASGSGG